MCREKGPGVVPESLVKELRQLSRAQKLRVLHMLSEDLGEQDWVFRAYTPDGDGAAAKVLQETLKEAEQTEPTFP